MTFKHWFHHLFNPHCPQCEEVEQEKKVCQSCEVLKLQLAIANDEKRQMLETILSMSNPPKQETAPPPVDWEKLRPRAATWNIRKQMLETEDRRKAQILAQQKKDAITNDIAKLEEELGVQEGVTSDAESVQGSQESIQS